MTPRPSASSFRRSLPYYVASAALNAAGLVAIWATGVEWPSGPTRVRSGDFIEARPIRFTIAEPVPPEVAAIPPGLEGDPVDVGAIPAAPPAAASRPPSDAPIAIDLPPAAAEASAPADAMGPAVDDSWQFVLAWVPQDLETIGERARGGIGDGDAAGVSDSVGVGDSSSSGAGAPRAGSIGAGTTPRAGNVPPSYPRSARLRGFEGTVVLEVAVRSDGTPASVEILRSSGYDVLDRAAVAAVLEWRFEPARVEGRAVASTVEIPIRFALTQP